MAAKTNDAPGDDLILLNQLHHKQQGALCVVVDFSKGQEGTVSIYEVDTAKSMPSDLVVRQVSCTMLTKRLAGERFTMPSFLSAR